jgi:adenylosuccinate synthase
MPNAGHTTVIDGRKIITKVLPSACTVQKPIKAWISPNSAFWWRQLIQEWEICGQPEVNIHERAIIMHEEFEEAEAKTSSLLNIASTCQGAGAAQIARMQRRPVIMRDVDWRTWMGFKGISEYTLARIQLLDPQHFAAYVRNNIASKSMWLHEVSQGFALGLQYGTSYPYCTSRECSAIQAAADMGLPPAMAATGDVYLNVRSFPIRVGNTKDGQSGDWWGDTKETTLPAIMSNAGAPEDVRAQYNAIETTTVTKRARRFCEMSWDWLRIAAEQNGATKLALNFVQYIDWKDYQCRNRNNLSSHTRRFIEKMEKVTKIPVVWVGTGQAHEDMIWMD